MKMSPLELEVREKVDFEFIQLMGFKLRIRLRDDKLMAICLCCEKAYFNPKNDSVQRHMAVHHAHCGKR